MCILIRDLVVNKHADIFVLVKDFSEDKSLLNIVDPSGAAYMFAKDVPEEFQGQIVKIRGSLVKDNYFSVKQIRLANLKDSGDYDEATLKKMQVEYVEGKKAVKEKSLYPKINELKMGMTDKITFFALIKRMAQRETAEKKPYVDFELSDRTDSLDAKLWNTSIEQLPPGIVAGSIVCVTGTPSSWNGKTQLKIESIRLATEEDSVSEDSFYAVAPIATLAMYEQILALVNSFKNEELKKLTLAIYEQYKEKLLYFPSAMVVHHAIKGGLLFHVYQMLRAGLALSDVYFGKIDIGLTELKSQENPEGFSKEMLITGILLHDIGKMKEMEPTAYGIVEDYTICGKLMGHIVLGNDIVARCANELGISEETAMLVQHMILSHHYEEKWGSYVKPQTAEAELLHHLDLIDARLYQFKKVFSNIQMGTFSERQEYLEKRQIYRPY